MLVLSLIMIIFVLTIIMVIIVNKNHLPFRKDVFKKNKETKTKVVKVKKNVDEEPLRNIEGSEEDDPKESKVDLNVWKKIIKIIVRDKKTIILMIITVFCLGILDTCLPIINKYALEHYFVENPELETRHIYIAVYIVVAICYGLTVFMFVRRAAIVEESTTMEIRKQAFDKLQKLSFSYYDTTSSGWVMARMTSDARRLSSIISWGIVDCLWSLVVMVGILIASFIINWRLALIILALIPIFLVIAIFYRKKILKEYRSVRKINSAITASFNESFMGANTSKTLVIEDSNMQDFDRIVNRMRKRSMRAAVFSSLFWPTILVIGYIGVAIVSITGARLVLSDIVGLTITTGTLYIFIDYTIRFFDPVMSIARIIADFQQAQASAERVLSLIETEPDVVDTPEVIEKYGDLYHHKTENWEPLLGDIDFDNVSFKYKGTDQYVLKDFNLSIKKGQTVALVGETGSGKSTIVNLICRFYEPTEGRILIDGRDYKERSYSWLHANLGYVLQAPHLFSGTIMENIRYGKLNATDEEVIQASKIVNAHEFIEKLDEGYLTDVGEGGNKLSIGQKQLISFARAIIANPQILILDEATSSIDTENEQIIQQAMKTVMYNRTSLVVAHRLSTVVDADKILVLKNGVILEMGTHMELLKNKGYYFQLYKNQFLQEKEAELAKTI